MNSLHGNGQADTGVTHDTHDTGVQQLQFEPVSRSNMPQVLTIERASYDFPWSEKIFLDCLDAGYCMLLAYLDDQPAGFVIVLLAADEAHILNLCVKPDFRQQGLAHQLLSAALVKATDFNAREVFLEVRPSNVAALKLYEGRGFNQIARRPDYYNSLDGREDALVFALTLSPTLVPAAE